MIYKSTSPLSPNVTILFDGVEVNYKSVYGAELYLEENKHDLLVVKMAGVPSRMILDYLDAPVYFVLTSGPGRLQTFIGYVSNIEPSNKASGGFINKSPFQEVNIYCVGASYAMKGARSARWTPPTLNNVVTTLARRYEFSADFPATNYVPNDLSQVGESDWEFLVNTVDKYGYRVTVHNTHIHVWDVYSATGRLSSYHELVAPNHVVGAQPGSILSFNGVFGSLSPTGVAPNISTSFLDNQGRMLQTSSKDVKASAYLGSRRSSALEDFIPTNAKSFQEAQLEAVHASKSNMPFEAEVMVAAGSGIIPGGVVSILNYNAEFDGRWYVRKVHHDVHQNHYVTRLELTKDGVYDDDTRIAPVSRFQSPPEPTIIDRRWITTKRRVNEYV